jgi:hypothetical protein
MVARGIMNHEEMGEEMNAETLRKNSLPKPEAVREAKIVPGACLKATRKQIESNCCQAQTDADQDGDSK